MRAHGWIRTVYLYTFSLLGLVLVIIGTVRVLDMGLKALVFKQADEQDRIWEKQPPYPARFASLPNDVKLLLGQGEGEGVALSDEQKREILAWLEEYKSWRERQENFDPVRSRRERDAANSTAFIIVGVPVFLYHWRVIKREVQA